MTIKIKDYPSKAYPVVIEAYNKGRMFYQSVLPGCMTDAEIRFQINSLWSSATVKDLRSAKS